MMQKYRTRYEVQNTKYEVKESTRYEVLSTKREQIQSIGREQVRAILKGLAVGGGYHLFSYSRQVFHKRNK